MNVRGLHVAMHHTLRVRIAKRLRGARASLGSFRGELLQLNNVLVAGVHLGLGEQDGAANHLYLGLRQQVHHFRLHVARQGPRRAGRAGGR